MESEMKMLPDLSSFTGTMEYHKLSLGSLKFTDGWAYLANKVQCFWLADLVCSVTHLKKIMEHEGFIIWRVVVKDSSAVVSAYYDCESDGSYHPRKCLYSQDIKYTDFPEGEFEFYQSNGVVLLKGEY